MCSYEHAGDVAAGGAERDRDGGRVDGRAVFLSASVFAAGRERRAVHRCVDRTLKATGGAIIDLDVVVVDLAFDHHFIRSFLCYKCKNHRIFFTSSAFSCSKRINAQMSHELVFLILYTRYIL